jgi:hypothetical protein
MTTLGHLSALLLAADRVAACIRRPTASTMRMRLLAIADDPDELARLMGHLERLQRAGLDVRGAPVVVSAGRLN